MFKKILILISISLFIASCSNAKKDEIDFKNNSFNELLKQAEKENKLIFIDCYTSWCAPCKWMDKNVFVRKEVADFYNANFINLKLDMEKGEGIDLAKKYEVNSFPTYLFIDHTGKIIHKANSRMSAEDFIIEGEKALNPSQSIGVLAEKYENSSITLSELVSYAIALKQNRNNTYTKVLDDIIKQVSDDFYTSKNGWEVVQNFIFDDAKILQKLHQNKEYYIKNYDKKEVDDLYRQIIQREMYTYSREKNSTLFFKKLDTLKLLNPPIRDLAIIHSGFFVNTNNAEEFTKTTNMYLTQLDNDPETIAFIARSASSYSENPKILAQAGKLITIAYNKEPLSYGTVGTYASIQSKLGNIKQAIIAAELAVKMADTISSKIKNLALKNLENIKSK